MPHGYKTSVEELGSSLSGGESHLDSLNEGIILKSIYEERKDKTIIFVSYRDSTLAHCNRVIHMESNRVS